jgi:hypothetical protein
MKQAQYVRNLVAFIVVTLPWGGCIKKGLSVYGRCLKWEWQVNLQQASLEKRDE